MTNRKDGVSRRELLIGVGSAAVLNSGILKDGQHGHGDHAGRRHENHTPKHEDLLALVNNCLDKGQRC